jgi:hypothetical protein
MITEIIRINNFPHHPGIISSSPAKESIVPNVEAFVPA